MVGGRPHTSRSKKGTRRLQQCADADQILRVFLSGAAMTQPLGPFFFVFLQFLGYPPWKESPTLSLRRKHGHTHTHTHIKGICSRRLSNKVMAYRWRKRERMEGGYTVWTPEWHWARASRNRTELNRWSLKRYGNSSNRCVLSVSTAILGVRFSFFVSISKVSDRHKEWPRPEMAGGQKGSLDARTRKRVWAFFVLVISSPFLKRKQRGQLNQCSTTMVHNHFILGDDDDDISHLHSKMRRTDQSVCINKALKKIKLQRETNFLNWYRNWETCTREKTSSVIRFENLLVDTRQSIFFLPLLRIFSTWGHRIRKKNKGSKEKTEF